MILLTGVGSYSGQTDSATLRYPNRFDPSLDALDPTLHPRADSVSRPIIRYLPGQNVPNPQ